ncbi:carbohydrate ABC transporter permease [Maliponia aquimaris]|uniref:Trehalose transport system permease protein SugA n=1 Tax=Maliponia aquimaris TaxID=1673631 RepID=A0A238KH46_9RHOB|nr:sugar ABC transporter permease [Maliponia aquimaris]SMX42060.1 Trehalose transport system permease protein SugA [Maliponia aquimaris]
MHPHDNRAWLFVLPAALVLGFVGVIPLAINAWHSLFDIFTLEQKFWVGTEWYTAILGSDRFYHSLGRSLMFSAVVIAVQFPLGLAIALALPRDGLMRALCLVLLAVPLMVPWNMIPAIWLSLINPDTGYVGRLMAWAGIAFDYKFTALHTWILLVAMDTWHWVGLVAILSCSGLAAIAPSYYQAAAIDSATRWQVFRFIELPKLAAVLTMALLLRFMDSFMIYTEAFGINAGGPSGATAFLSLDLGEEIKAFNYGPAAARSVIYFALALVIVWGFWRALNAQRDANEAAR